MAIKSLFENIFKQHVHYITLNFNLKIHSFLFCAQEKNEDICKRQSILQPKKTDDQQVLVTTIMLKMK